MKNDATISFDVKAWEKQSIDWLDSEKNKKNLQNRLQLDILQLHKHKKMIFDKNKKHINWKSFENSNN